ncbi:MAG: undecaprenyl/decaprenyl-phosphate alpha-N-acetylglucosaminyl 1-phosphate transferase [Paramuribaculum sp.]|nr:undecaprenyl/decaprenyl-phosphate alpha-N-acetylglucosaminyl 1-phosphate transferase [Paramuribaculum sp.]
MSLWILNSFFAMLLSILFAGILIPQILLISFRKRLFDTPDERKIHKMAVPRLGGFAFTPVIILTVSLLFGISILSDNTELENDVWANSQVISFGICALLIMYLTGMADDLIGIRYSAKFFIQIFCSILIIGAGIGVTNFHGVLGIHEISPWIGIPFTIVLVVYVVNALNLIDGIDGLASGLASATLIIYGSAFLIIDQPIYAIISFAALGALIQFFYYNVFGDPKRGKKIFMGDTGSLTIGLLIVLLGLVLLMRSPEKFPQFQTNPVILVISPLIIPSFDVARVFLYRIRMHGNPFMPDKNHIHHKLLAIGLKQRMSMVLIVISSVVFSVINIFVSKYINVNLLLLIDILIWTLVNMWLSRQIRNRKNKAQANFG